MRKVLSFVLVLSLVLSSFSMAFAADAKAGSLTDISGNANEDAIQVGYDLGIVTGNPDGTFLPDKAVNRAEFAAMLTRALSIPDSALSGYTTTSFKDTAGYGWAVPYLAFCQSKGILLGDGQGNVMPGRTVSVNEAMTMALRAIGYTANSSLLVGVWPSNYVSIAQNEDLYDDVAKTTTVNKASAAQIIYNLLTVQKVAVNTDGTTDYLWKNKSKDIEANLLNTNLGCEEIEDAILGYTAGCTYDDAIINISKNLGAYGTAYINDDDELIAFTKDSTALTGKLNDKKDKFEVGDIEYNIKDKDNTFATDAAMFVNGDSYRASGGGIEIDEIESWALSNSDDEETVTINVDLSGKTIKDIYSVVAWTASDSDLADSDVQEDIGDNELLGFDFVEDDNDNIDPASFELIGVTSLDKIIEDHVVYVYADKDENIRRVAVGTETVEGVVDEIEYDGTEIDTITIGDKEYGLSAIATDDAKDLDVDSEGTYYLDAFGDIYDFDGTSGKADTYGVVVAWKPNAGDDFDNPKVRLYLSDDSEKTFDFSEKNKDVADMEWVLKSDLTSVASINAAMTTSITKSALIGYSLDKNGEIDTIDVTSKVFAGSDVTFQSSKVLKINSKSFSIDSQCVVFTYKEIMSDTGDYDVASLKDVENGTFTSPVAVILNDDGDVAALFVEETNTSGDDYVYAVINTKTTAKDSGGDKVSKFTGYIDGSKVTYLADDEYGAKAGAFDVYRIKLDSSNIITKIESLTDPDNDGNQTDGKYKKDEKSGWINGSVQLIVGLGSNKTVITVDSNGDGKDSSGDEKFTVADDAVIYKYDRSDKEFEPVKLSALKDNGKMYVRLYDTKGKDADGIATVVVFYEL